MYKFLESISLLGYPVVFKGAMLLKTITDGKLSTSRMTRDIDMIWEEDITIDSLTSKINKAVENAGLGDLEVIVRRTPSSVSSAGIDFYEKRSSVKRFSADIQVNSHNKYVQVYTTPDRVTFKGSQINKIIVDKLTVLSTKRILRRAKDFFDLYMLSCFSGYLTNELRVIINDLNIELGSFEKLTDGNVEDKQSLNYAYSKLGDIENKPSYKEVYDSVSKLVKPFVTGDYKSKDLIWDSNKGWLERRV